MLSKSLTFFCVLILCACAKPSQNLNTYFYLNGIDATSPSSFDVCHEYGCQRTTRIEPAPHFWEGMSSHFSDVKNAQDEREAITFAIADFEKFVGKAVGTSADVHGTYVAFGEGQQDCVDESTNTSVYLTLLQKQGLLKFHDVGAVERRDPSVTGRWWHQTATITERASGARYAVDSWFEDNGYPAYVVPLKLWAAGWTPENPLWKQSGKYDPNSGY